MHRILPFMVSLGMFVAIPVSAIAEDGWRCPSCGQTWADRGDGWVYEWGPRHHLPVCRQRNAPPRPPTPEELAREARRRAEEKAASAERARAERLRAERDAEEARERLWRREAELRMKNQELQARLKTSPSGGLQLKTMDQGVLRPQDAIFGNAKRESGEGFVIKRSIPLGRGELEVTDSAFEVLRRAAYLMGKAREAGRPEEESRFLLDQAGKAMRGGRLDVVVPPPEKTPVPTKLTDEYKQLAVNVAVGQSRAEFLATLQENEDRHRRDLEVRRKDAAEKAIRAGLPVPPHPTRTPVPAGPAPVPAPTTEKPKPGGPGFDLLKELERIDADLARTEKELGELREKQAAAETVRLADEDKLAEFLLANPDLAPREKKEP